jgi:hypothetical protein
VSYHLFGGLTLKFWQLEGHIAAANLDCKIAVIVRFEAFKREQSISHWNLPLRLSLIRLIGLMAFCL